MSSDEKLEEIASRVRQAPDELKNEIDSALDNFICALDEILATVGTGHTREPAQVAHDRQQRDDALEIRDWPGKEVMEDFNKRMEVPQRVDKKVKKW